MAEGMVRAEFDIDLWDGQVPENAIAHVPGKVTEGEDR